MYTMFSIILGFGVVLMVLFPVTCVTSRWWRRQPPYLSLWCVALGSILSGIGSIGVQLTNPAGATFQGFGQFLAAIIIGVYVIRKIQGFERTDRELWERIARGDVRDSP